MSARGFIVALLAAAVLLAAAWGEPSVRWQLAFAVVMALLCVALWRSGQRAAGNLRALFQPVSQAANDAPPPPSGPVPAPAPGALLANLPPEDHDAVALAYDRGVTVLHAARAGLGTAPVAQSGDSQPVAAFAAGILTAAYELAGLDLSRPAVHSSLADAVLHALGAADLGLASPEWVYAFFASPEQAPDFKMFEAGYQVLVGFDPARDRPLMTLCNLLEQPAAHA